MPTVNRREMIGSLVAGAAWTIGGCRESSPRDASAATSQAKPIRTPNGSVDWRAVREQFPLSPDLIHLATYLFVSMPKPVAEMVELYRKKIDADTLWIERAAFDKFFQRLSSLGPHPGVHIGRSDLTPDLAQRMLVILLDDV